MLGGRLGTRRGFLAIMIFWSLACASHALAAGFGMLAVSRFLPGLGEGGGFPAAAVAAAAIILVQNWLEELKARVPVNSR